VNQPEQLWQWIEQAIVNYLVPTTFTHDVVAMTLPQGNVLAVNVPASRHLVSLWDRDNHTVEYVRRTSHGKEWMNPDEVERHLMDGSRATKLALIAAKAQSISDHIEVVGGLWRSNFMTIRPLGEPSHWPDHLRWNPPGPITIGQMEEYWFELHMTNDEGHPCAVTIPYGLIKEAWVGASGVVTLMLTVRIVMRGVTPTLEPYA